MHIESLQHSDIAELAHFAAFAFDHTFKGMYRKEDLQAHLDTTCSATFFERAFSTVDHHIYVAKHQTDIIGYMYISPLALPIENPETHSVEIQRLYVHPDHARQGIGRQFIAPIMAQSDAAQCSIYLGVYSKNETAKRFYARHNFQKVGEYSYFVGRHIDHEYIMKRSPEF